MSQTIQLRPGEISLHHALTTRAPEHHEYPKWITDADGNRRIVENEEEERLHAAPRRGRPRKVV